MKIEQTFGRTIVRIQCSDPELYKNKELVDSVNRVFDLDEIKNFKYDGHSQVGQGLSFCQHPYLFLNHLPGAGPLTDWITKSFLSAQSHLGKTGSTVEYKRAWGNRIFKDCEGRSHTHQGPIKLDAVGIFYTQVPENSSDLVILKHGPDGKIHSDFIDEEKYFISPKEGELIIHDPFVPHTITKHNNTVPRSCFVYDIVYKN